MLQVFLAQPEFSQYNLIFPIYIRKVIENELYYCLDLSVKALAPN
jgi:hypothetical protein